MDIETRKETPKSSQLMLRDKSTNWLSPFGAMEDWLDEMESGWLMPRTFRFGLPRISAATPHRTPKVDIIDREKEICVRAELPGIEKDDLSVSIQDDVLTIQACVSKDTQEDEGNYYRREMVHGEYRRALQLPAPVEAEKARASFKHGIVEIVVPKKAGYTPCKIKID